MKKKQLFAVLLAGSMTVGMAPAAAFAAEDTGAVTEAEATTADENTETPDDGAAVDDQSQSEADSQAEAEAQAAAQAQAEAEAQAAAQAQAEAEAQAAAQAQAEAEAQAAAQAQAEEAQQEQTETVTGTTVTDEVGLAAAIAAAPGIDINNVNKDNLTTIVISGTVQITTPVTIPKDRGILIVGKDDTSMIQRAAGFTGNLFDVSGALYMLDNSDSTLVVDGGSVNGVPAAGSLIHVASGAKFSMSTGLTLTNNKVVADATTADTTAAAIFNEGGIVHISGGTIENNSSDRGAVYSTGKVFIEKIDKMAEPIISKNTKADGTTPANIILAGEGQLAVNGAITDPQIGFSVENAEERLQNSSAVIVKGDDCSDSDYLQALSVLAGKYEDVNYKVNPENGQLVSNKPTVNIDIPTSEEANTVSVTFTSDKAGTYYYKYVAKGAEAPTIEKATEGGTVKAGETTSLKLTKVTDKTIDLYIWVKESESGNDIVGEGVKKDIAVTQAQNPDNPKPAAPKVTKISAESKTATTAEVVLQSDKSGKCYYKCVAKGADKPSITAKDNYVAITEKKDFKIDLKNLKGDAIDLYVQVVAKDGSKTAVTKIATVTLKKETAKTPAKISNISYKWKSHTSATVTMRSDKAGVYYYKWVKRGSKAPTVDKMSKGKNVSANKDFTISLKDLDANNAIDVYVCIKGTDGTISTPKKIALDEAMRPANVKWIAFEWTSHTSAVAKFVTTKSGKLYYAWVTRDEAGNSKIPDIYNSGNSIETGADREISIYLNDLDPDNAIDLYVRFKDNNGIETVPLKLNLKEENRPAEGHNPKSYKVSDSRVYGLDDPLEFYPNTFYEFRVVGAGTDNDNPGEQDVKWVPLYWSTSANPSDSQKHSAWKIGSGKGINKDATYNLYVFFQKYIYTGGQWQETDTIESAVYQFRSAKLTPTGTPGADGTYGTGGQTGSDPDATITGEASATSSNGGNGTRSKNAVSTADNSPIGTMSALAVASLLAGGYVIVRRRKKDI